MRIATLQFSPQVGAVAANFSQAEALLMRREQAGELVGLDLLVLPELAFTGYNHPSLSAITPYLEPTASGPSTRWAARTARRLQCTVAVGYPEAPSDGSGTVDTGYEQTLSQSLSHRPVAYNSLVFVDSAGDVVAHYRKTFLYYTDDTWATEGAGFYAGVIPLGKERWRCKAAAGICMDINPYKFQAPWTAYEFANHCLSTHARLVVLSTAWLTRLSHREVFGTDERPEPQDVRRQPDMNTLTYWIERFEPLLSTSGADGEVIVVFANRAGEEGVGPIIGEVIYAGTSCVMGMRRGSHPTETKVKIWNVLGRAENDMLLVDTDSPARYAIHQTNHTTADNRS